MLTWNEAIEQAQEPTDIDRIMGNSGVFGTGDPIIGEDGKVADTDTIRERAVFAYVKAHAGEMVHVTFCDPDTVNLRTRLVYQVVGELKSQYVRCPRFVDGEVKGDVKAVIVGDQAIPLHGVSSIATKNDNSVVVL